MNKKNVIITLCCFILFIFIVITYRENIIRLKRSTRLNYCENVAYIAVEDSRLSKDIDGYSIIEITDSDDIEIIIDFLNSLKLIEDNLTEYEYIDLDEVGYFTITIFRDDYENDNDAHDVLAFETNYLSFIPNGHDWTGTRYYIKNSGYDNKTKNSNVHQFLLELINK